MRTPPSMLVEPPKPEPAHRPEDVARMEREMASLELEHKHARERYGDNVLRLRT